MMSDAAGKTMEIGDLQVTLMSSTFITDSIAEQILTIESSANTVSMSIYIRVAFRIISLIKYKDQSNTMYIDQTTNM